jgi:hypothetical protein
MLRPSAVPPSTCGRAGSNEQEIEMSRTASWLAWAAKHEDAARACDKAGDWRGAAVERETAREGLRRAGEVFAEEPTKKR